MAFPLANYNSNMNLPDPRLQVVDYAGAFKGALDTFIKVRQFGLENQLKQRQMDLYEQKMQLDVTTEFARMDIAKADLEIKRNNQIAMEKQAEAAAAASRAQTDKTIAETEGVKANAEANSALETMRARGMTRGYDDNLARLGPANTDPLDVVDAGENLSQWSSNYSPYLGKINARTTDPYNKKTTADMLNAGKARDEAMNVPRHNSGRYIQMATRTDNSDAALRLLGKAENIADLPQEERDKRYQLATLAETQTKISNAQPLLFSTKELLDGVRMGDPEKTKIFLRDSKDKGRAFNWLNENYGGDKASLMQHDVAPKGDEYAAYRQRPPMVEAQLKDAVMAQASGMTDMNAPAMAMRPVIDPKTQEPKLNADGTRMMQMTPLKKSNGSLMSGWEQVHESWDMGAKRAGYPKMVREQGHTYIDELKGAMPSVNGKATGTDKTASTIDAIRTKLAAGSELTLGEKEQLEAAKVTEGIDRTAKKVVGVLGIPARQIKTATTLRERLNSMTPSEIMNSGDEQLIRAYKMRTAPFSEQQDSGGLGSGVWASP